MKFTKVHGAGNDFIIINMIEENTNSHSYSELAKNLCARKTSVGADGLMIIQKSEIADFKLLFYNSDGSLGEMCGNGARCIARYGFEHGLSSEVQRIETTAGIVTGERISETLYRVRLNDPTVIQLDCEVEGEKCSYIELGNPGIPHAVVICGDWDSVSIDELCRRGNKLRHSPAFSKGANVSFVKLLDDNSVKAITYERGVEDFTLACGTGSGSIVTALTLKGLVSGEKVKVSMPGGYLFVTLSVENGAVHDILLTGPTCVVFSGEM